MDREHIEAVRELSREVERDGRTLLWAVMSLQDDENAVRTFRRTGNAMMDLSERVGVVLDALETQQRRIEELENAVRMADENIGWVTDASADRHVKEVLRKALGEE